MATSLVNNIRPQPQAQTPLQANITQDGGYTYLHGYQQSPSWGDGEASDMAFGSLR